MERKGRENFNGGRLPGGSLEVLVLSHLFARSLFFKMYVSL